MKQSIISCLALIMVCLTGCAPESGGPVGSSAVKDFLDSYEETIAIYEETVSSGTMANYDIMALMKTVNEMNEKSLEMSQKSEALKDEEWTSEQEMRFLSLSNRFGEALLKMSQQLSSGL